MLSKYSLYFLVLLTFWAQLDDALLLPTVLFPSASFPCDDADDSADGDDECLPSQRPPQKTELSKQAILGRIAQTVNIRIHRSLLADFERIAPFTPPSLYLFMSLQI